MKEIRLFCSNRDKCKAKKDGLRCNDLINNKYFLYDKERYDYFVEKGTIPNYYCKSVEKKVQWLIYGLEAAMKRVLDENEKGN